MSSDTALNSRAFSAQRIGQDIMFRRNLLLLSTMLTLEAAQHLKRRCIPTRLHGVTFRQHQSLISSPLKMKEVSSLETLLQNYPVIGRHIRCQQILDEKLQAEANTNTWQ